ncbi:MAG: transketolase [Candidatus Thorarchaeota archaeon]|nr:MAG: transketolase [Candidatus Thorarchaeota archaeon]
MERAVNTIRFLSADAVQKANSGHPGMPMGTAVIAYTLWTKHLRHNPKNPDWYNRDRFILSGGHGSMLLYSLLHLTGYDLSIDEVKNFRQWESKTPGHPECWLTPGVEVTTGPLGQGFGNGVGMAIAEKHLSAVLNKPDAKIVDHYTYIIATDGDMMEGVSSEAASLAGHLGLGKLIVLYDDNKISIDGSTDLTFTENVAARFEAFGWHTQRVDDGNDFEKVDKAIAKAKQDARPSIILCRTHIGYGLPTKQDTAKAHGEPAGEEELAGAKKNLGWPLEPWFHIPEDVLEHFRQAVTNGEAFETEWQALLDDYRQRYPETASEFERRMDRDLIDDWDSDLPVFTPDQGEIATRAASGKTLNVLAARLGELMGGSADLTGSNKTWIDSSVAFQKDSPEGRNLYFGVREHAMGAIVNGLAAHGGIIPYGASFLVFSDYMRPAIRLSSLSRHHSIWIFTHDSIGLGEDGPTHQPIEHLAALRAIPDLVVIRPGDANEVVEAWKVAVSRKTGPTLIALTRQNIPILDRKSLQSAEGLRKGAYVLADLGDEAVEIILMATGSELHLIVEAAQKLAADGIGVRLVSFPSWELFSEQDDEYRRSVLPDSITARLAVEAGISQGWEQWVGAGGDVISIECFGSSAPHKVLFKEYGFTSEHIAKKALEILKR